MTRPLQGTAWEKFKVDGRLFEQLAFVLLQREFPGCEFHPTQQTRDGGRDFEGYIRGDGLGGFDVSLPHAPHHEKWWAEAKSSGVTTVGHSSLSFNDITKTMYMAYLEDVNKVIVFSYAPFNQDFWRYVNPVENEHAPQVIGYSGASLDRLILKHLSAGSPDYGRFFGNYHPISTEPAGQAICSRYRIVDNSASNAGVEKVYSVGECVEADFYVSNDGDQDVFVQLELAGEGGCPVSCLTCFNSDGRALWTIPAHSGASARLRFKIIRFRDRIRLPTITVRQDGETPMTLGPQKAVRSTWLADVGLVGRLHRLSVDSFGDLANSTGLSFASLSGRSGTGKSRILREIEDRYAPLFENVCRVDADTADSSSRTSMQSLVSQVESVAHLDMGALSSRLLNEVDIRPSSRMVAKLMFDSTFDIECNVDALARRLHDTMIRRRTLILVDNVQNFDPLFISLLDKLIDLSQGHTGASCVALTFNTDNLSQNKPARDLRARLHNLSNERNDQFLYDEVKDFSRDAALEFLRESLIGPPNGPRDAIDYPVTYNLILDKWGTNPFVLKQMLICLYERHVVTVESGSCLVFHDVGLLHRTLDEMPKRLRELLHLRVDRLLDQLAAESLEEGATSFLSLLGFTKALPPRIFMTLFKHPEVLRATDACGITTRNDDGDVTFSHRYWYKYFAEDTYYSADVPYVTFSDAIGRDSVLLQRYYPHYFIATWHISSQRITSEMLDRALETVQLDRVDPDVSDAFFKIVAAYVNNPSYGVDDRSYLKCISKMTTVAAETKGVALQCEMSESLTRAMISGQRKFAPGMMRQAFHVVGEFLRGSCSLGKQKQAARLALQLADLLERGYDESREIDYCWLKLRDCQTTISYKLQDLDDGIRYAKQYGEVARRLGENEYIAKSFLILGNVYYHDSRAGRFRDIIGESWHGAFEAYTSSFGDDPQMGIRETTKLHVYMRGVLADLMCGEVNSSPAKIEYLENCIGSTGMAFFEIKTRLTVACYLIAVDAEDERRHAMRLIDEAADLSVAYGSNSNYIAAMYLKGVAEWVFRIQGPQAVEHLQNASVLFIEDEARSGRMDDWDYLVLGMLAAERFDGCQTDTNQLQVAGNRGHVVRDRIEQASTSRAATKRLLDDFILLYCPGCLLGLPKV